jgi:hypothetical protein
MMGILRLTPVFMLLFLSACHKDIPKPKFNTYLSTRTSINNEDNVPVLGIQNKSPFFVRHYVKGKNLFVECMLSDISFRNDNRNKKTGKLIVYVDGKKTDEIYSSVFIIKGMPVGDHTIELQVVNLHNQPYSLKEEFTVTIP